MKQPKSESTAETPASPIKKTDFILIFDVRNGNPNGDPDRANAPRTDRHTGHGLVTPVCLKRKIRNYVSRRMAGVDGYQIYIEKDAVLGERKAAVVKENPKDPAKEMCRRYYDVRLCGGLLSANKNSESKADSITGPLQITFAESIDKVMVDDHTITRCAAENAREGKDNKTMGVHHTVPYGLYVAYGFLDPVRAAQTGLSLDDIELLKEACENLFENDRSTQRGTMAMRAIYAFEHECPNGTRRANGVELLESIQIRRREGVVHPRSFSDYEVTVPTQNDLPKGVTIQVWKEPFILSGTNRAA
jgi:CRISPR-associated protein Csd2